jgi:hypothetical protein
MLRSLHQVLKREAVRRCIILTFVYFVFLFANSWVQGLVSLWDKRCFTKVSYKNKFFFTFILNDPHRKVKSTRGC